MYAETDGNAGAAVIASPPPSSRPARDEGSDHVVIGRLIRRLRVSEPPDRFHVLATTVLRSSLGVEAVAWVPQDARGAVVVAGAVDGMEPSDYRTLIESVPGDEPAVPDGTPHVRRLRNTPHTVGRYARAEAGTAGSIVAVNTPGNRPLAPAEIERLHYVASLIETQLANARIYTELKGLLFGVIRALTTAIDAKDPYTSGHSERVARIAVRISDELAVPSPRRSDLYLAGLLHDVGKIGIDDDVLKKAGPLSDDEYRKIQSHVEIGVNILRDLTKLSHILPGVRHHHESYDGSGYPDHLSGEEIPLEARILAVADSYDAMSSNRPYRKRLSLMQIDEIFCDGRGRQWDPDVVDALFACRADIAAIRQKGLGESLIGAVDVALGQG
jgi:HD-GYP domain-containing protein (c-di-GMP phosphodiesterase class II)